MQHSQFGHNLIDVASIVDSGVDRYSGNKKYIKTGDIQDSRIVASDYVTYQNRPTRANMQVREGDVLFARMNATNKVVLITKDESDSLFSTGFAVLRPNRDMIIPGFLARWLRTGYFQFAKDRVAHGATQKSVNNHDLGKLPVPLPPLEIQSKAAEIFDRLDKVESSRAFANEIANDIPRSVFLKLFGDPVANPLEWNIAKIEDLADVWSGGTPSRKVTEYFGGDIPWVTTTQANDYIIDSAQQTISELGLKNSNAKVVPKHTILLAMIGAGKTRGMTTILGIEAATNQNFAAILPSTKFHPFYLWQLLRLSYQRLRNLGRGVNQPALNLEIVKSIQVPVPPLDLQSKFARIVGQYLSLKGRQEESVSVIEKLFQSLQNEFFLKTSVDHFRSYRQRILTDRK